MNAATPLDYYITWTFRIAIYCPLAHPERGRCRYPSWWFWPTQLASGERELQHCAVIIVICCHKRPP